MTRAGVSGNDLLAYKFSFKGVQSMNTLSIDFKDIIIEDMDFETLYSQMQGLIFERALFFHRTSGILTSDLISFGNEVFVKAVVAWASHTEKRIKAKETIKKFSSFLHWRLTHQYTSYVSRYSKYLPPANIEEAFEESQHAFSDCWFEMNQMFLSKESRDIIRMIVKHEDYFISQNADDFARPRDKLLWFLKEKGFSYSTAKQCINEIKTYLKELHLLFNEVSSVF